jgi:hypothetical protein
MAFAPLPRDPVAAGRRLADYVVLGTSADVPLIAADYWELSVAAYRDVQAVVTSLVAGRRDADDAHRRLSRNPQDEAAYRDLAAGLARILAAEPGARAMVTGLLDQADPAIWIDHVMGEDFSSQVPACELATLRALPAPPPRLRQPDPVPVNVVIPFRDREQPGGRSRNLLACLRSLADQDMASSRFRITVVETDAEPRAARLVAGLADRYLFGYNSGIFNKSWAVNLGLRDGAAPGAKAELTCVLDADILVERSFVRVNAARFAAGHDAHLPYQHMYSLDDASSDRAIRIRLGLGTGTGSAGPASHAQAGAAQVDAAVMRGLLLRETPGACLWARTAALCRIGGFDERFEGWGGEDDDVVSRLRRSCELVRYDDQLLHLSHPRPAMVRDDGAAFNAHLAEAHRTEPWAGADGFGDPGRFCPPGSPAAGSAVPGSPAAAEMTRS